MATVNAAREEFEAAKTRTAALRAAGKVPKEAVIRVFVILLDILIVVLLEKTTHEPELRSAAVTDGQGRERAGSNGKGPKPNRQMGDNLRKTIVEETVAACDACGADIDGPVDRERRVLYDIVFEVVERRAEECPKCKARGRFPDNIPCSTASASKPSSSTCWSPKCCPCAVPSRSCRRSPASSSPRQPASAMLSRCVMGGGRRGAPPATPNVDETGFRINSKWLHVVGP